MSRTSRAVASLLSALLLLVAASAAQAKPEAHPVKDKPKDVAAFWTKERMQTAKPRERARPGGSKPGGGGKTSWTGAAVPLPYSGVTLTNGKVFFTENGGRYVCSGTSVTAPSGKSFVWTAGHCVNEGPGAFVSDFMFAPGYVDGATPHGKWTATTLYTTSEWRTSGNFSFDLGAASVVPGEGAPADATLGSTVGARNLEFNYGVTLGATRFTAYGYPAATPFNGQRLHLCDSAVVRRDGGSPQTMGIGCDMTGGSSGGGWISAGGNVGSVNSYGYQSLKNTMFGPFQGPVAQQLYASLG